MEDFFTQMQELLKDRYDDFLDAINKPPKKAIRVNTLKISRTEFKALSPFTLSDTPFCENGFVVDNNQKLGLHPYYHAGLYYPQEPSAMAAVSLMKNYIGKKVLDMCASPGGKSTHAACFIDRENGILISNEIIQSRCSALLSNIERMGISNCAVTNNSPKQLQEIFKEYFDTIIVDAPCSGEGMFRKNSDAIKYWSKEHVKSCSNRQYEILCSAHECLQCGGYILYSTCTYNKEENENTLQRFLDSHDYTHIPLKTSENMNVQKSYIGGRIYPHLSDGEGHYIAIIRKNTGGISDVSYPLPYRDLTSNIASAFKNQIEKPLDLALKGNLREFGDKLYIMPNIPYSPKLRLIRAGILLCETSKNTIVPHHNLATTASLLKVKNIVNISSKDKIIVNFLRGETLDIKTDFTGFGVLSVDGFPLSIVKSSDGIIKNHYPKALRKA